MAVRLEEATGGVVLGQLEEGPGSDAEEVVVVCVKGVGCDVFIEIPESEIEETIAYFERADGRVSDRDLMELVLNGTISMRIDEWDDPEEREVE